MHTVKVKVNASENNRDEAYHVPIKCVDESKKLS
jgi:hypothetical protein